MDDVNDGKKPETWPADNPDAKDPLERHSLERAREDAAYFKQHREWAMWAFGEVKRRERAAAEAQRLDQARHARNVRMEEEQAAKQTALEAARQAKRTKDHEELETRRKRLAATTANF